MKKQKSGTKITVEQLRQLKPSQVARRWAFRITGRFQMRDGSVYTVLPTGAFVCRGQVRPIE